MVFWGTVGGWRRRRGTGVACVEAIQDEVFRDAEADGLEGFRNLGMRENVKMREDLDPMWLSRSVWDV